VGGLGDGEQDGVEASAELRPGTFTLVGLRSDVQDCTVEDGIQANFKAKFL
jgi:hypothetical protein